VPVLQREEGASGLKRERNKPRWDVEASPHTRAVTARQMKVPQTNLDQRKLRAIAEGTAAIALFLLSVWGTLKVFGILLVLFLYGIDGFFAQGIRVVSTRPFLLSNGRKFGTGGDFVFFCIWAPSAMLLTLHLLRSARYALRERWPWFLAAWRFEERWPRKKKL